MKSHHYHVHGKHALTQTHVHPSHSGVGRAKKMDEQVRLTLVEGSIALMDDALRDGEDRLVMIRDAISAEMERRGKPRLPTPRERARSKKPD